ncbi:MAG: corrinoid protein [Deltaproteobacteria bacterium]|nr:corrinoid protein [Deltaproteobacteria bacterium]MBW2308090.1 corrinoid protein [Deltaproteobacteria bacterium]
MSILENILVGVVEGKLGEIDSLVQKALDEKIAVKEIIDKGLIKGMSVVAERWKAGDYFVPEVLRSAKVMQMGMDVLKPHMAGGEVKVKATFAIGTVKGDLHDIGKNLVSLMVEGAGYEVINLGIDVDSTRFVQCVQENPKVQAVGLSALLTTTMPEMKNTVDALKEAGLRDRVKVFIGGAPVTQSFADEIGADYYSIDAAHAIDQLNKLFS